MPGWCQLAVTLREQRSRLLVGQNIPQLCLFQESPEKPSVGPPRRDEEPTSTRNLPSTKRRGRVPATPEQVCEMPPCDCPRFGIGCHYFRCSVQALSSSTQGPLKPTERSGAIETLLFYAASSLSVGNPPTTRSCGIWPVKRGQ